MSESFSIREAIAVGWGKTRAHSALIFKVLLTLFALQIVHSIVAKTLMPSLQGVLALFGITVLGIVLGAGAVVITLKLVRGEHAEYTQIMPPLGLAARYFFASALAGIITVVGLVLLIIPGIYLMLRFSMVRFAALDGNGIVGSLKKSGELTEGVKWKLLGFLLTLLGLNFLGFLLLVVGLIVTVPITMIAYAHVYQKLLMRVEREGAK